MESNNLDPAAELVLKYEKLQKQYDLLQSQMKKMSEREMESRARANAAEEIMEKFFDKMLSRMN